MKFDVKVIGFILSGSIVTPTCCDNKPHSHKFETQKHN